MARAAFFQVVPFLLVDDVAKSAAHWSDVLGFNAPRLIGAPPSLAILTRNAARVTLRRTDAAARPISLSNQSKLPGAIDLYISVSDIDAFAAELKDRGADIVQAPDAARRELTVRDDNNYLICFGEELNWPY